MNADRTFKLDVPEDYRFASNLGYLARSPNECLHRAEDGRLYKALPIDGTPVVEIRAERDRELTVAFLGQAAAPSANQRMAAENYIREWLDLDTDLAPFYRLAEADPILAPAAIAHRGLRLVGIPDLQEAIAWGILGQQINLAFAYELKRRLVEAFGTRIDCEGTTYWTFPQPHTLASLAVKDLLPLRMTVKKCEYLIRTAELLASGECSKDKLAALSCREAEKALVRIRGIGPWTANYVLMRCLRKKDAFPIDDVGLHNAIRHLTGSDAKPSRDAIVRMAAGWRGWEAYATYYLWRMLY